jgi:hypothetical protein
MKGHGISVEREDEGITIMIVSTTTVSISEGMTGAEDYK